MFCPDCGEPHELKANFCSACGTKLARNGDAEEVRQALERHVAMGARVVAALCQVGRSWTAACILPPKAESIDESLSLAEVNQAAGEKHGFKRMVFGPSCLAVERRFQHMKQLGARLVGEIEQIDDEWVAVLDMDAGSTYRW